jgi:SNF family Na+-dependent transporter
MKKQCKVKCKYHIIKIGFLYAVLSLLFSTWEIYYIFVGDEKVSRMLIPFIGLILCLVSGIILMLKDRRKYSEHNVKPYEESGQGMTVKEYYI